MTKSRKRVEISEVVIHPVSMTPKGLVGYISFVFCGMIKINEVQIFTRPNGGGFRFVYPLKPINGKFCSIVFPINKEVGEQLEEQMLHEYLNFLGKFGEGQQY